MAEWIEDPQGRAEVEKVTKELKLPVWKANYKGKFRDFWNELWDKIEDYCLKLKEGGKKTDDRLNSAIGRNDGDFPIANAVVGNVYYSDVTKKYYKCKVGGPAPMPNGNFIDLSILENLNTLENLIKFNSVDNVIKIGNFVIETVQVTGYDGIRTGHVKTNFKKIYSVNLIAYANKGQTAESLMRQVMHTGTEQIEKTKTFELYAAGNQTILVTFLGEV